MDTSFSFEPKGPFDLLNQNQYFNGWPTLKNDSQTIVMAFPVEGWQESVAVTLRQEDSGRLQGKVYGLKNDTGVHQAKNQALAAMSLDVDGTGWPEVGTRDEFIGKLQRTYRFLRPTLFHSPYEAAAAFIIGHRISIPQARKLRAAIAQELGSAIEVEGERFYAFPSPQKLFDAGRATSLSQVKIERLQAVAEAAQEGWLERSSLRALESEQALQKLETLPGVGPFFSQGMLYRGAGLSDGITTDDITRYAIQKNYEIAPRVPLGDLLQVAEQWRPYRMWVTVLMHLWQRQNHDLPPRTFGR